jgi:CheY-like chemotaxis protein
MLSVLGFKTRVAYGSGAAMRLLAGGLTPTFICLDINMPGVKGTEILAYLRREPRLKPVPVFVITSDDQPETRREVMKLGANVMIVKPATIDALEDALRRVKFLK